MPRKPADLLYGVDDRPLVRICLLLGIQHIFFLTTGLIECLLGRVMHRLRVPLPPEVTGVVLTMVGFNVVPIPGC